MKLTVRTLAAATVLCIHASCGHAQDSGNSYRPANFPADQTPITSRIPFPASDQDVFVRVNCDVRVGRTGRFLLASYCFSPHADAQTFIEALEQRIDKSTIEPAQVNGRNVPVWLQYTVQFERRAGVETIKLFPHQFFGIAGPGDDYTSPQRYHDPALSWCSSPFALWFSMMVPAEGGRPTEVNLMDPVDNENFCGKRTRGFVQRGLYIPAFLNGVAVSAPSRELWFQR